VIRRQLETKEHPVCEAMARFDDLFYQAYQHAVERGTKMLREMPSEESKQQGEALMRRIIQEVQAWVRIVFFTVLKFYRLNLLSNQQFGLDVRKDLLLNMVTSLVLAHNQTYSIVMNVILQANNHRVK
jgi:hypothetical protein